MSDEDEPAPASARRWLAWALIAAGAAAGLWLAALPLERLVPEPAVRRTLAPEPPEGEPAEAPAEAPLPPEPPAPEAARPAPEPQGVEPPATAPDAEWVAEDPGDPQAILRARLERQLAMNDLGGVRVEIAGDRVVTSGVVSGPGDRQRVALLVRSLAPGLVHEDRTELADRR